MKDAYYFGHLIKQIDFYGFPRTGSHFLQYALSGLYDLISLPHAHLHNREAIDRQQELNDDVLYALDLREDGAPYQPIHFDPTKNGMHGQPVQGENPVLVLIRDPVATVYSYWRMWRDRLNLSTGDPQVWVPQTFGQYIDFYTAALQIHREMGERMLLVRYEDLLAGPEALERIVAFVGLRPKQRPSFVHWLLRFEHAVKPGQRTFYRAGNNTAWREDGPWREILTKMGAFDFTPFGYQPMQTYLDR